MLCRSLLALVSPDFSSGTTVRLTLVFMETLIVWIAMKFSTDIHAFKMELNWNTFGNPLTLPSTIIVQHSNMHNKDGEHRHVKTVIVSVSAYCSYHHCAQVQPHRAPNVTSDSESCLSFAWRIWFSLFYLASFSRPSGRLLGLSLSQSLVSSSCSCWGRTPDYFYSVDFSDLKLFPSTASSKPARA